jgi:hypothetical protein
MAMMITIIIVVVVIVIVIVIVVRIIIIMIMTIAACWFVQRKRETPRLTPHLMRNGARAPFLSDVQNMVVIMFIMFVPEVD